MYQCVLLKKEGSVATITLNRPEKLNALNQQMQEELRAAFRDVAIDDNVRVVILTGAGRGFCSGADLSWVSDNVPISLAEEQWEERFESSSITQLLVLLRGIEKPTICALNGVAAGAGTVFALQCDILIASDQARFRVAFTRLALPPEYGLAYLLTKRIGTHRALELAYTNGIIDAKEMERIGLVNRVVPHDELMKCSLEMAKAMLQIPPYTLAMTKRAIYNGAAAAGIEPQLEFDHALASTPNPGDKREARKSFTEKRDPHYEGK